VDLLGAQAAVLALEQREDLLAGAARAMAGAREFPARMYAPAGASSLRAGRRHDRKS
jgi:hypothetical protein